MKIKHVITTLALAGMLGAGAFAGIKTSGHVKEAEASGTAFNVTFQADVTTFEGWGGCSNYSFYPMTSNGSGGYKAIDGYSWDSVKNNATVTNKVASATLGFASNETVDAVIFYFTQGATKQTEDMVLVISATETRTIVFNVEPTGWSGNTFSCVGDTTPEPNEYSLIGAFGGHNWDYDLDFEVNETTKTATLNSVSLASGDSFKVRKAHRWNTTYGWSNANGHIDVTDPLERGESCLSDANDSNNIAVDHNGTYNFSLKYDTGVLTITGTRANSDTEVAFEIWISTNGGAYVATEMTLKPESTTEYMITRDFVAGEKAYFKYGASYYHYAEIKNDCTLKGTQFVANGQDLEALYNANYTIYFDLASATFGCWLQYNSVSEAQVRANVISYAEYFNDQVGGVCDPQGKTTVVSDLQTAWSNVKTRYDNEPADSVRTAIKGATASDTNAEVKEFVEKYASVYELRGNSLSTQGGDFLQKGITPVGANTTIRNISSNNKSNMWVIVVISSIAIVSLLGASLMIKRRKEDR